jgi:hypothetical protein
MNDIPFYKVVVYGSTLNIDRAALYEGRCCRGVVSADKLSEYIANAADIVVLNTADTHTLTCCRANPKINSIVVNTELLDSDVHLLNSKQIISLTLHGKKLEYFINQLAKFEHLHELELVGQNLIASQVDDISSCIRDTNIRHLAIRILIPSTGRIKLDQLFIGNKLQNLCIYFKSAHSTLFALIDGFDTLAINKTITYLSIDFDCCVSQEIIEMFANAIKNNTRIHHFRYNDLSLTVHDLIVDAICEHCSIGVFETFDKRGDIKSYIRLLTSSSLISLYMYISERLIIEHIDIINEALSNNFHICRFDGTNYGSFNDKQKEYIARNRRLLWYVVVRNIVDFAMIFLRFDFDPYIIAQIFDEWYEPAGKDFYCARKIATIYNVRNSINKLVKA